MNLRNYAAGKPCQIRLPGICNFNPETTVLAHFRMIGVSGMSMKSPDLCAAWACSACHLAVDSAHDDETQLAFAHGVLRTIVKLLEAGVLQISFKGKS